MVMTEESISIHIDRWFYNDQQQQNNNRKVRMVDQNAKIKNVQILVSVVILVVAERDIDYTASTSLLTLYVIIINI